MTPWFIRPLFREFTIAAPALATCLAAGCAPYIDPNVPEPIRPYVEPEYGGAYELYRPSDYDRRRAWPLIILCPAAPPDRPNKQIRDWTQLAEVNGFVVAALRLEFAGAFPAASADRRIALLRENERRVLATVQHIRAGHHIAPDRIFIHGWSEGTPVALRSGLLHPDLFRAISLIRPQGTGDFHPAYGRSLDPNQPLYVRYDGADKRACREGLDCVRRLRTIGLDPRINAIGPCQRKDSRHAMAFFKAVIDKVPWIRIGAVAGTGEDALSVQFKLRCSFQPTRYRWAFGDGAASEEGDPMHVYAAPGSYRVTVILEDPQRHRHRRDATLRLPDRVLLPVAASG